MQKREPHKDVGINGRRWRIGRFDAMTGSYLLYKILTQALPAIMTQLGGIPQSPLPDAMGKSVMGKEDFLSLQRDCLNVCMELKEIGGKEAPIKVVMPNGSWGVEGLDDDVMTVMALTLHALVFNLSSFFDEDALKGLMAGLPDLTQFGAKTSTDTPMPQ